MQLWREELPTFYRSDERGEVTSHVTHRVGGSGGIQVWFCPTSKLVPVPFLPTASKLVRNQESEVLTWPGGWAASFSG